jgi:hypothetical protein
MATHIRRFAALFAVFAVIVVLLAPGSPRDTPVARAAPICPQPSDPGYTTDSFPSAAEVVVEVPGMFATTLTLDGPTTVARAKSAAEGNPNTIETELLSMNLTGVNPILGNVTVTLNPGMGPSCGQIAGGSVPPAAASFFDVFYQISVTAPVAGSVSNTQPLTVQQTIRQLPPTGQTYIFKGQNQFSGLVNGRVTMVKHIVQPTQLPSWTIDDAGPGSVTNGGAFHPAAILHPPAASGGPATWISCPGLGLLNAGLPAAGCGAVGVVNNVDGFSYGFDFSTLYDTGYVGFSVAPGSLGATGTAVSEQATCPSPEPETDEFGTLLNGGNYLIYDGNGVPCAFLAAPAIQGALSEPAGAAPNDDVDGLDNASPIVANGNYGGGADLDVFDVTDTTIYYSLAPGSPALPGIPPAQGGGVGGAGASPADILVCGPPSTCSGAVPTTPVVYVQEVTLGLKVTDDIDAICLRDGSKNATWGGPAAGDHLVYSLAPGSPTLPTIPNPFVAGGVGAGPSDLIYASAGGLGGQIVIDPATALGLLAVDNLNAVKCVKGIVDVRTQAFSPGVMTRLVAPMDTINPVGFTPPPPPNPVQYVGDPVPWALEESKVYDGSSPMAPLSLLVQGNWRILDTPGAIRGQFVPDAGDACTLDGVQVVCDPLIPYNALADQDDLHFNFPIGLGATVVLQRDLYLTCEAVGLQHVRIELDQLPLGADDRLPTNNGLVFDFDVDCQNPPCTGPNFDDTAIGNGRFGGVSDVDDTVPNGDSDVDSCDTDDDNDGLADGSDSDPSGDDTYDDDNDGDPASGCVDGTDTDAGEDGPSWDTDCDGVRDGVTCTASDAVDNDGDNVSELREVCKWGTSDNSTDSDGDGLTDCLEIIDVNGDEIGDFLTDLLAYAQAALLPAAAFGKDGDFDLNGDNTLDFLTDVLGEAVLVLLGPMNGGCDTVP